MTAELLGSLATAVAAIALVMTLTALVARAGGRIVVVDVAWGLGFVLVAVACALLATVLGAGDAVRTWLVTVLVAVWGLRLARHIHSRSTGGEDPRYEKLLGGPLDEVGMGVAVRKVFVVQGVAMTLVALPVAVGSVLAVRWWPLVVAGGVLWLVGLVFESVGDAQLARYRSQPRDDRPAVLETGLWRYTRHPNYFGDACVWWGVWLAGGAASGVVPGLATVVAPLAMTWFLMNVTGAKLLEQTMMQRPAYRAYAARTSRFVPLPPRTS